MCAYYSEPTVRYNEHSKYIIIKSTSYLDLHAVMLSFSQINSADSSVGASLTGIRVFQHMASIYMWGAAALLQKPATLL